MIKTRRRNINLNSFSAPTDGLDVRGVTNRKTILEGYENVQAALLDYTLTCYSSVSVSVLGIEEYFMRAG